MRSARMENEFVQDYLPEKLKFIAHVNLGKFLELSKTRKKIGCHNGRIRRDLNEKGNA